MATKLGYQMRKPAQVLWCRIGHDVAVLRPAHDPPCSERQAADDDEMDIGVDQAREKLIEGRSGQLARCAASRNSNNLRVSTIVSLRFTASGRCPSARRRNRRICSPSGSSTLLTTM